MSRLVKTMVTTLIILLIVGSVALILVLNITGESNEGEEQSIDKVVENSFETEEITTDLEDGSFVRIQFQILTDGKAAKKEITKRDFQLKNILIKELAILDEKDFKAGLSDLEDIVKDKLNEVMLEGEITDVYTISKILQ